FLLIFFFFSSRRRHTRFSRDWSSDVCSSDLVSIVGTIGFIGLVAPHIARRLVGFRHLPLMLSSGLLGGLLLVTADFIGRTLIARSEERRVGKWYQCSCAPEYGTARCRLRF